MITKAKSPHAGFVLIHFELPACLWADRIYVVGEFNEWARHSLPMQQNHKGVWELTLELPIGASYEFRYLVDDHWITDGHADGLEENPFGTQNSIVRAVIPLETISAD